MEQDMKPVIDKSRKRKANGEPDVNSVFPLDELNEDMLEQVLAQLPASSFFRLHSVCKRWRAIAASTAFQKACMQIPFREPWFLMVDQDLNHSIVFDSSEKNWKDLTSRMEFQLSRICKPMLVAASGGLVCYRTISRDLIVCNPVTGACRELPSLRQIAESQNLHAIAMYSSPNNSSSYRIVTISGELPNLSFRKFDSIKFMWEKEVVMVQNEDSTDSDANRDEVVYYLSKAGDVVATNMQRSLSKQYSSVLIMENGEEVVYFLSHSGTIVACNLSHKTFSEFPRLLPAYMEHSIDVVECKGTLLVAVLSEFLETASLRLWKFSKEDWSWHQVAAVAPSMSHEYYGKKADINCTSSGNMIFMCISSGAFSSCITFDAATSEWAELHKCYLNDSVKDFVSAFAFEPRLEASV